MGGDELDARPGVDSSAHLKLEKDTVLTAGTASRRGTRLSSMRVLSQGGFSPLSRLVRGYVSPAAERNS